MARCKDFPCCGHESGCCPDYDKETGQQLNMKCTCGATMPLKSKFSICDRCMKRMDREDGCMIYDFEDRDYFEGRG